MLLELTGKVQKGVMDLRGCMLGVTLYFVSILCGKAKQISHGLGEQNSKW